jgi:hypothetical protein
MNKILSIIGMIAILVIVAYFISNSMNVPTKPLPYEDISQVISDINTLPAIGIDKTEPVRCDWRNFVSAGRRIKVTDPLLVESALWFASTNHNAVRFGNVKIMILLRVCFSCPANKMPTNIYSGWVSFSAEKAGRTIHDLNWPVGEVFGHFYMKDTLDGYVGQPYDPVAEFRWMRSNCKWRNN